MEPPRMVKCPECGTVHKGRQITFDMSLMHPHYYRLYNDNPQLLWESFFICRDCERAELALIRKAW